MDHTTRANEAPFPEHRRYLSPNGYIQVYLPGRGLVYEHRLVMEVRLGRPLTSDEHIHHKNKNRADNRDENLELISLKEHSRLHNTIYTREILIDTLRELANRIGRIPRLTDCDTYADLPSRTAYQNHFGKWNQAIAAAELPYKKPWALHYHSCQKCGTTDRKHRANGICRRCYLQIYRAKNGGIDRMKK